MQKRQNSTCKLKKRRIKRQSWLLLRKPKKPRIRQSKQLLMQLLQRLTPKPNKKKLLEKRRKKRTSSPRRKPSMNFLQPKQLLLMLPQKTLKLRPNLS